MITSMISKTISPAAQRELERVGRVVKEKDDAWAVPPASGEFLHAFVLAGRFTRGLELGTSYGFSGLWLGSAFLHNGGALTTIEKNPAKAAHAREAFQKAGLHATIASVEGDIVHALQNPALGGPFDFAFVDAEKESSLRYFELLWPRLAPRATIVTDNATSHADALAGYLQHLRNHAGLCSVLVPIGSGLEVSVKA